MNMDDKNTKNVVIVMLLTIIVVMVTAVVVLAHNNDIYKPKPEYGRWNVVFTSIAEGKKTGNAKSLYYPYYTATYASFYATFVAPGDSIEYDVQISNLGNIDSRLSDIVYVTNPYKDAIKYEIEGINRGDILKAREVRNIKIKISYELTSTAAYTFDKPIAILFDFVQA